jgi:hypothetical protein
MDETLALLAYLVAAGGVLLRAGLVLAARPRLSRQLLAAGLVAAVPLAWYGLNVLVEPLPAAGRRHVSEILGAVLPGLAIGCVAAMGLADLLRAQQQDTPSLLRTGMPWWVAANAITVAAVAAFLASNTGEGILLVSTALLAGAESYQTLGDILSVNLLVLVAMAGLRTAAYPSRQDTLLAPAMSLLCLATVACAVLVGSNKLLMISLALSIWLAWLGLRARAGRYAGLMLLLLGLLVLLAGVVLGLTGSAGLDVNDLLALTRLLDYGNVDSLLDTPSIASRLEILSDCAGRQFALNPWFGDLAAEFKTCGDGHYLHSLLSIQTHLGLVGTASFLLAVGWGLHGLWCDAARRSLRIPVLLVLGVGLIGAYFTWMPFWFVLGWMFALQAIPQGEASRSSAQT